MASQSARPAVGVENLDDFIAAFAVSRETAGRLKVYADLLVKWQKTINLVAPSTLSEVWQRHIADSAQIFELAPVGAMRWADLGSGAGFPGLVLAILLADRTGVRLSLVESDSRKCAFLAEVVRKTGIAQRIAVEIVNARIETAATQARLGPVDVITARALAPLERLCELSVGLFGPGTVALFLKGREALAEVEAAAKSWQFEFESCVSLTDPSAQVIRIRGLVAKTGS